MTKVIYIESEIKDHKRTQLICSNFKNPEIIIIDRLGEVLIKEIRVLGYKKLILL